MTAHRDLKSIIRARQHKTGESYTAARAHVMRERAALLGHQSTDGPERAPFERVDAVVLKVNQRSARVRVLSEDEPITFRSSDASDVVPGHLVTLVIDRRWRWRDAYASGRIEDPRIDVERLGLVPLPLRGGDLLGNDTTPQSAISSTRSSTGSVRRAQNEPGAFSARRASLTRRVTVNSAVVRSCKLPCSRSWARGRRGIGMAVVGA